MKNRIKEFDMKKEPITPKWYFKLLMIILAYFFAGPFTTKSKIIKHNFKSFKEPALVFSNHGSFVDFANLTLAMFPYLPCYVSAIDEFVGKEWIMRQIGCFPKRKFTTDLSLIRKINNLINKKNVSVAIYPEARFSLAGVNEDIGSSLGKMAKLCKCRIIVMNQKGNFLRSPQWNKHPYRKVNNYCDCYEVASKNEVITLPAEELQKRIEDKLKYDEYKWQYENKIKIKSKKRAQNIHQILYKCCSCNHEGMMDSKDNRLWCNNCKSSWTMNEYGVLIQDNKKSKFELVSQWYNWEKEEVIKEVNNGTYHFEDEVRIEKFVNSKVKFKSLGTVKLIHNDKGYFVNGILDDGTLFNLEKPSLSTRSMHIEFNYKGKGNCLDLATIDDTWFAYPLTKGAIICKFNFATEALYFKNKTN